jgi:sarcosine oxidase
VTDGQLAVVGVGSVGSMVLWQAAQRCGSVVGFEAASPAHPRSAVGGDTRLFRMTYRGEHGYYPLLQLAERQWRRLEEESGHQILTQCGGLSIGEVDGSYIPALLDSIKRTGAPYEVLDRPQMERRYPQHRLGPTEVGILDQQAGFLRTDRAVLTAVEQARQHGAAVEPNAPVREMHEEPGHVVLATDRGSWTFDRVVLAAGGWSGALLPQTLRPRVSPYRIFLTWFAARRPADFAPEHFPIFIHITGDRSLYGAPCLDGSTVKATLDGRGEPTPDPATMQRSLTDEETAESEQTVEAFLPGLVPSIVRSDTYPDLYTDDHAALLGSLPGSSRIYCATGFSGGGFKMASAFGTVAAAEALGESNPLAGLDFLRPQRFMTAGQGAWLTRRSVRLPTGDGLAGAHE